MKESQIKELRDCGKLEELLGKAIKCKKRGHPNKIKEIGREGVKLEGGGYLLYTSLFYNHNVLDFNY